MKKWDEQTKLKISQTKKQTLERRKSQTLKVYEVKVDIHNISKENLKKLDFMFTQAKWAYNDCLASEDPFKYKYNEHRTITRLDKNQNPIQTTLTLPTDYHRCVIEQLKQNIITLSQKKKKGQKIGVLKFKSEINSLPLKTGRFNIRSSKTITIPGFRNLKVYGLEQFINLNHEIADARVIKKPTGFYIKLSVYFNKNSLKPRQKTNKSVGLDFGIKNNITTSDGETFSCEVRESEYLKFLQRKLNKKQKNSKRYWKLRNQIQKEYEHLSNKKQDAANKLVSKLFKEYDQVYIQDEQIQQWKRLKSFSRIIQHSYLDRVKAKIQEKIKITGRGYILSKWHVSTRICPVCGTIKSKEEFGLKERIFVCECGYKEDRDVNA